LRCSRELLIRHRCSRLSAICDFPVPPDRNALAAVRAPSNKRKAEHGNPDPPANSSHRQSLTSISLNLSSHPSNSDTALNEGPNALPDIRLSAAVETLLQDVYFTCMFYSTLFTEEQAYAVTKAAQIHLVKYLAEISSPNIRVNCISHSTMITVSVLLPPPFFEN
jgi:hypothetical protein